MKRPSPRAGDAARIVVFVTCILLAVPMLLISLAFVGWRASSVRAAEQAERARAAEASVRAVMVAEAAEDEDLIRLGPDQAQSRRSVFQPVTETEYRTESIEIEHPVLNQQTGQMELKKRVETRMVPVQSTRWVQSIVHAGMDPAISRLVRELTSMDEDDENRDRKMEELRQRLELEFASMHDQQQKEINQTQERLETLKKLHQQRGENRDKIVQRRIDDLLGRTDVLEWEINADRTRGPMTFTGPSNQTLPGPRANVPSNAFTPRLDSTSPAPPAPQSPLPPPAAGNFFNPFAPGVPPTGTLPPTPPAAPDAVPRASAQRAIPIFPTPKPIPQLPQVVPTPAQPQQWIEEREERIVLDNRSGGQLEPSTSTISRIFELVRKSTAAEAALQGAESKVEQYTRMFGQNAIPSRELQVAKAELTQIRREVELSRMELQALADAMRREQSSGEEQLENAKKLLELAKSRVDQGLAPTSELIGAERELSRARERLDEAKANLEQLDRATSLIGDQEVDQDQTAEQDDEAERLLEGEQELEVDQELEAEQELEADVQETSADSNEETDVLLNRY